MGHQPRQGRPPPLGGCGCKDPDIGGIFTVFKAYGFHITSHCGVLFIRWYPQLIDLGILSDIIEWLAKKIQGPTGPGSIYAVA